MSNAEIQRRYRERHGEEYNRRRREYYRDVIKPRREADPEYREEMNRRAREWHRKKRENMV